jgi:hypothetical protein
MKAASAAEGEVSTLFKAISTNCERNEKTAG